LQRNGENGVSESDDETKIGEFVLRIVSSDLHLGDQHEPSSSEPCPKRLRSDETLGGEFSLDKESRNEADQNLGSVSSPDGKMIERIDPSQVLCKERAMLLRKFKQEQRRERRRYKGMLKAMWDEEITDGKEI
jgi:hypothetical protein